MKKRKQKKHSKKTALPQPDTLGDLRNKRGHFKIKKEPETFEQQMNKIGITKIKKEKPFNIKEFLDSINLEQPALRIKTYKGMKFLL